MYHLVYTSTATVHFTAAELQQFLVWWRASNSQLGVTGILLYSNEGDIIQVLEGEQPQVEDLFAVIERDLRHRHVLKLAAGPIKQRLFGEWCMSFRLLDSAAFYSLVGYANPDEPLLLPAASGGTDTELLQLLSEFASSHPDALPR
ncbi:BLUF domain-containing protein [Hymenobacter psychrophilus]|uniref:Sensors of blue-light using FAD n=1 Tax=Hymenobacter psychrophilus TaxID=651662 RepID=A0A1H3JHJ9_9BACT|nr:BLUF domain-containing protein [Hymenobacter psychrophilus]SDY39382.1 Sensors of blue-light using FAD [Hymenobacter psychrophilus]